MRAHTNTTLRPGTGRRQVVDGVLFLLQANPLLQGRRQLRVFRTDSRFQELRDDASFTETELLSILSAFSELGKHRVRWDVSNSPLPKRETVAQEVGAARKLWTPWPSADDVAGGEALNQGHLQEGSTHDSPERAEEEVVDDTEGEASENDENDMEVDGESEEDGVDLPDVALRDPAPDDRLTAEQKKAKVPVVGTFLKWNFVVHTNKQCQDISNRACFVPWGPMETARFVVDRLGVDWGKDSGKETSDSASTLKAILVEGDAKTLSPYTIVKDADHNLIGKVELVLVDPPFGLNKHQPKSSSQWDLPRKRWTEDDVVQAVEQINAADLLPNPRKKGENGSHFSVAVYILLEDLVKHVDALDAWGKKYHFLWGGTSPSPLAATETRPYLLARSHRATVSTSSSRSSTTGKRQ